MADYKSDIEIARAASKKPIQDIGARLDIPAGTAVRFEPGESKIVGLVEIAGAKLCYGGNALIDGGLDRHNKARAIERMKARGFACTEGVE